MLKRKAADGQEQDGDEGAKKPRSAAAAAAGADGDQSLDSAALCTQPALRVVVRTLQLVKAVQTTGSHTQRTQAVIDLLQADADRSDSLIDLSLVVEGEKTCVMFQLLRFFHTLSILASGSEKADKRAAERLNVDKVLPFMPKLLRSFDPAIVDATAGNNALHEMCRLFSLVTETDWPHRLTELLIIRGVSLHARNKQGRTPLLQWAACVSKSASSASGLRLLLAHGADLNAQDGDGNGLLHWLIRRQTAAPLDDLFGGGGVGSLNISLRNSAGQTAADLAAIQLAEQADTSADTPEWRIHQLIATHSAMRTKHAQPVSLHYVQAEPQEADAAAANGSDSLHAALASAKLGPHTVLQTLKVMDAIKSTNVCYTQLMQVVVDLLEEDADRPESLIDLSLVLEGEKSCVLFQLLKFFCDCCVKGAEAVGVQADKDAASNLVRDQVLPLMPKLLRSFDPATVDATTGSNALHKLCRYFDLPSAHCWAYKLAELLISKGVSLHARNKDGRTPLLQWAADTSIHSSKTTGLRLLLAHGADPDVQDSDGDGLLHRLVISEALVLLKHLFACGGATLVDHALRNLDGQTAADLAAIRLAEILEDPDGDEEEEAAAQRQKEEQRARQIHQLLVAQAAMWTERARPALLCCLESVVPVPDLATLALGYVDGSGLPFDMAAEAEDDEEADDESAAEAAAAAQS